MIDSPTRKPLRIDSPSRSPLRVLDSFYLALVDLNLFKPGEATQIGDFTIDCKNFDVKYA